MKKQIAVLCTVLLWVCAVFAPMARAAGPALSATEAYCIIDADTGLVLAQQNMDEELHPASITKVMTLGLACEKAQGQWDGVSLEVTHEDVYSLAGTDSSHIALQEGEHVPLTDALYATMMASANDGANLLSEYFGDGTIAGGVAAMNAQVAELGLKHTHFANPHGISDTDHYTSCYDMAQILRWALTQPGFETLFTRNEMYPMKPTDIQPKEPVFPPAGQNAGGFQPVLHPGHSRLQDRLHQHCPLQLCLPGGAERCPAHLRHHAEQHQDRQVQRCPHPAGLRLCPLHKLYRHPGPGPDPGSWTVAGGGAPLGMVTVTDPGTRLLLADGLTAGDVSVTLELPEQYVLGTSPAVYAVYTVNGQDKQESTSVRVPATITGLEELLERNTGVQLGSGTRSPGKTAGLLIGISLGCTVLAAGVAFVVVRLRSKAKKKSRH